MRGLVVLLLAACVCVATIAQEADKCDTPEQWEGYEVRLDLGTARYPGSARRSYISYDARNSRFNREDEVRTNSNTTERYRELYLHMEKVGYRINLSTKPSPTCERFTLTEPFRPIGVPSVDTLAYKAIIGTTADFGAGVEVNGYTGDSERGRSVSEWIQPGYDDQHCVPAFETFVSRTTGEHVYSSFYNITMGIKNPTVFIPPSECQQV